MDYAWEANNHVLFMQRHFYTIYIFFRLAASHTHDQVAQLIASLLIKGMTFIPLDSLLDCFDLKKYFKLIKTPNCFNFIQANTAH